MADLMDRTGRHSVTGRHSATDRHHASTGELVSAAVAQLTRLVRDEIQLARAELADKGRRAGRGAGMFGAAGLLVLLGAGCLTAAGVLGLANVLPAWLATVIVGGGLLLIAGLAALAGRRRVAEAAPPVPEQAIRGVQLDARTVKEGIRR